MPADWLDITSTSLCNELMNDKQNLVQHYRWLRQYGLNDSHSGNASFRSEEDVWITPTGACADTLNETDLIRCNIDGSVGAQASLDAKQHLAIYAANQNARAVLHSHGPYSVAMTMKGDNFIPIDFEGQYYFKKIPVITIDYADYLQQSPQQISQALTHSPVVILRGHGVYVCAESINLAYKWSCSVELSAKTAFIAQQAGKL